MEYKNTTDLFSWFATCSRSVTMVCCGSDGALVDVFDTVDASDDFFLPKKFIMVTNEATTSSVVEMKRVK
jgi:hypothetical protein